VVALIGITLALVANAVSPRGLKLSQDYFPGAARNATAPAVATSLTAHPRGTNVSVLSALDPVVARLQAQGLRLVESNQVAQLFRDPRYDQEMIVFVDARNDQHYQEGHIPGAYQFDHYHADRYLSSVLPVCQAAEQVVVYCTGGSCEDSEFAAIFLRDAGIAREKLLVYGGGITEWNTLGLPLELGGRKSGQLRTAGK
jgi:rhodanese-related sulfurtransferase